MNSYDENLRSAVVSSMQTQELNHKKAKAQTNASMFTLYYAEGATIMAKEQLKVTGAVLQQKTDVKTQAVISSNISNNLLRTATDVNSELTGSAATVSVAAANIQIAANAVVKLASDLGSIYGIVNAADFDSAIFKQTDSVRKMMDVTAYDAEQASQLAMEAAVSASEVSVSAIKDKAKLTSDTMNNLLKIASDEFSSTSAIVANGNAELAAASAAEKAAEGVFEDYSIQQNAASDAYLTSNDQLNLDLKVPKELRDPAKPTRFTVVFNAIRTPFGSGKGAYYPVKNYYVMLVKDSKKTIFALSTAENLVQNDETYLKRFVTVPMTGDEKTGKNKSNNDFNVSIDFKNMPWGTGEAKKYSSDEPDYDQDEANSDFYTLRDSDGDKVELGVKYVVFVMAVYMDDYKQILNNFSDFLSAPSGSFRMRIQLGAADAKSIKIEKAKPDEQDEKKLAGLTAEKDYKLSFKVTELPYHKVEYRCMFLPMNDDALNVMLTTEMLGNYNSRVATLVDVSNTYEPEIASLSASIGNMEARLTDLNSRLSELDENAAGIQQRALRAQKTEITVEINKQSVLLTAERKKLVAVQNKKKSASAISAQAAGVNPGFLFNLKIAEQVSAGNYISIDPTKQFGDASKTNQANAVVKYSDFIFTATITDSVTDNFGTPLLPGQTYIPIIVSACSTEEENPSSFKNNWSGYQALDKKQLFVYNP